MNRYNLTLPDDLSEAIEAIAKKEDMSSLDVIRRILEGHINPISKMPLDLLVKLHPKTIVGLFVEAGDRFFIHQTHNNKSEREMSTIEVPPCLVDSFDGKHTDQATFCVFVELLKLQECYDKGKGTTFRDIAKKTDKGIRWAANRINDNECLVRKMKPDGIERFIMDIKDVNKFFTWNQ